MRPLSVLIVDDDVTYASILVDVLEEAGHRTRTALTGSLASRYLIDDAMDADVVIADLNMPGLNGVTLYRLAAERRPSLADRFIFLTGDPITARDALRDADVVVLAKPITLPQLVATVEKVASRNSGR
jgi:DNA-binding NtrC family response regulator